VIVDLLLREKRRRLTAVSGVAGGVVALGKTKSGVGGSGGSVHGGRRGGSGNWSSGDRGRARAAGRSGAAGGHARARGGGGRSGAGLGGSAGRGGSAGLRGSAGLGWMWDWALGWVSWVEDTLASVEKLLGGVDVREWYVLGESDLVLVESAELLSLRDLGVEVVVGSNAAGWGEVLRGIPSSNDLLWVRVVALGDATTGLDKLGVVQIGDWGTTANSLRSDEPLAEELWVAKVVLDCSDVVLDIGSFAERGASWWWRSVVPGRSNGREAGKDSDKGGGVEQHFDFGCKWCLLLRWRRGIRCY